jgi:tetratricopeptide (TPR) repeat protein
MIRSLLIAALLLSGCKSKSAEPPDPGSEQKPAPRDLEAEAKQDPIACAHVVARGQEERDDRCLALAEVAVLYWEAGQEDHAREMYEAVLFETNAKAKGKQIHEMRLIAGMLADAGRPDEAAEMAKWNYDDRYKAESYLDATRAYAQAGRLDEAQAMLQNIESPRYKAEALLIMAEHYASKDKDKAAKLVDDAISEAKKPEVSTNDKPALIAEAAALLVELGDKTKARTVFKDGAGYASMRSGHDQDKAFTLWADLDCAAAVEAASSLESNHDKAAALAAAALGCDKDEAEDILDDAIKAAEKEKSHGLRAATCQEVALAHARIGDSSEVDRILDKLAIPAIMKDTKLSSHDRVLAKITLTYAEAGLYDVAAMSADLINKERNVSQALIDSSILAIEAGKKKKARKLLEKASKKVAEMDPADANPQRILLAELHARVGDFDKALEIVKAIPHSGDRKKALFRMVIELARVSDTAKDKELLPKILETL